MHNVLAVIQCYTLWLFTGVSKSDYTDCTTCNFELLREFWFIVLRDLTGQKNGGAFGLCLGLIES